MLKIAKQRTIYWEIRWRFSEDGHNNAGEVSDEFSILESSQNVFPMSGKFIRAKTMSDRDKVIESVVTETSGTEMPQEWHFCSFISNIIKASSC